MGARCTNHLASKIVTGILPPGGTFFRMGIVPAALVKAGLTEPPPDIQLGLAAIEKLITSEVESRGWRTPSSLSVQLLLVTGNVAERMMPDNSIVPYRLDRYVSVRDAGGKVIEAIFEDPMHPAEIPERLKNLAAQALDENATVSLLTHYWMEKGKWKTCQEFNGTKVPKSEGEIKGPLPFWCVRWNLVPNESYGRGMIEDYHSGFRSLEGYEKSVQDGSALAARHLTFVRPTATGANLRRRISSAPSGSVLAGNPEDIGMYQFGNGTGLQIALTSIERIERSLAAAFLLASELRRDAERVTAYELRMLVEELESSLGGTYTLLSSELQQYRLSRLVYQMQQQKALPMLDASLIDSKIVTGVEALGREQDVRRVMSAGEVIQVFGEPAMEYVKFPDLLKTAFSGLGLPNAVRTDGEVQQRQEQRAALEAITAGGAKAIGTAAEAAVTQPTQ